ncbi:acyltransferase family protein [Rhizobium sp. BK661]|uniref:acyltransferase family protein n=1 Tax=Rhizobium sp. BK661 TaxID=2586991 RepID=UPI002168F11B|nr:acyltransferase family protein [Rhizobium sp. BK661]MCS3742007.1 peptidoglycan/LPS O-acetylase OafA/YrhL [Rhizobium sp. BK661]
MKYRQEIDGLRAIAVLPVILFHSGFAFLKGGFAGVDVFFVISGFLITSIIREELETGVFTLAAFYERRARRIAPALFFVCLVCIPFAWFWMLPRELDNFGKSLFHVNLSVSNFLFWHSDGYFSARNELKPLLHTWSLAVEEQFYLLFPLLLILLRRSKGNRGLTVVICLTLVSFALTQVVPRFDPVANFYLLPTRFWELGAGAALALYPGRTEQNRYAGPLASFGLILVMISYVLVSESPFYPGLETIPVVLGTMLVLAFASQANLAGRLLSFPPLVTIGLWSYSLYLWHQPVLAFARIRSLDGLSGPAYLALLALCFLLAYLTYKFIEIPFRRRGSFSGKAIFSGTAVVGGLMIAIGLVGDKTDGMAFRSADIIAMDAESFGLDRACKGRILAKCATSDRPEIAVWGDSYAMHLVDGLLASQPDIRLMQLNKNNCGPFMDLAPIPASEGANWPQECLDHNDDVRRYIVAHPSLKYVVVSSPFRLYVQPGQFYLRGEGLTSARYDVAVTEFMKTLDWLRSNGVNPVVFAPPPQDGRDIGLCLARTRKFGISGEPCRPSSRAAGQYNLAVRRFLGEISEHYPVLDFQKFMCDGELCKIEENGVGFYQDAGHLSRNGSRYLGRTLQFYQSVISAAEQGCLQAGDNTHPSGLCELTKGGSLQPMFLTDKLDGVAKQVQLKPEADADYSHQAM